MKRRGRSVSTYRRVKRRTSSSTAGQRRSTQYRSFRGRSRGSRGRTGVSDVTTFQHDVKTGYRFRRAPRGVKLRAKRQHRAWVSNCLKELTSRKYHYSGQQRWTTATEEQGWFGFMNYGMDGEGGADGSGDVSDVWTRINLEENGTENGQTTGGNVARKLYFAPMKARATMTNTGNTPIYWEVYECLCRDDVAKRDGPDDAIGVVRNLRDWYTSVQGLTHQAVQINQPNSAGGPNNYNKTSGNILASIFNTGVTPFQFRYFCQKFKILKTTRFQCNPGNSISFNCGVARNQTITWDEERPLFAKKGVSRIYLVRQWGAMEDNNGVLQVAASSAAFEIEKDYTVKILDRKLPQLNYYQYTNDSP